MQDKKFYEDLISKWKESYCFWYYESMTSVDSYTDSLSKDMMKTCLKEIEYLEKKIANN